MTTTDLTIDEIPAVAQAIGVRCIVLDSEDDFKNLPRFIDLFPRSNGDDDE